MALRHLGSLLADEEEDALKRPEADERPKILIVDDEPTVRQSLKKLFISRYSPILCDSAQEGVAAMTDDVCAVILDIRMKGHDGFWACNEIRKEHPDVPVIFYSAYQDLKDPFDIINEHRPFGYITKDGDPRKLEEAVRMAVWLHRTALYNKKLVRDLKAASPKR